MGQVLDLMSGQAQFNLPLLNFIGYDERSPASNEENRESEHMGGATDVYYNAIDYCFDKD